MRLLWLRLKEWWLAGECRYLSGRIDEIHSLFERENGDYNARYTAKILRLRETRRQIALRSSPAALLSDVYKGRT